MIFTWRKVGIQRQLEREKRKLRIVWHEKKFWKMAQKKSQFPLPLILGQNWFLYWDFFSEISNIVLLGGGRKVLWIFCFVTVLDGIVPNCLGKLQLWQLFFPSNLKEKFVFQNAFSPFFLKVSQQVLEHWRLAQFSHQLRALHELLHLARR